MSCHFRLLPALPLLLLTFTPVQALGICEADKAREGDAIHVAGRIIEADAASGVIRIEDDCGAMDILVPGDTDAEVQAQMEACTVGATAEAIGEMFLFMAEASALLCEPAND